MPQPLVGKITLWNDAKGFGFITPHGGGGRVFFHATALTNPAHRPQGQEVVSYELTEDEQGRPRAVGVTYVGVQAGVNPLGEFPAAIFIALGGLVAVLAAVFGLRPNLALALAFYLAVSLVTYFVYSVDKARAQADEWRVSEGALHLLALIGGWPGALLAQRRLRHKVRKPSFMIVFWLTVAGNVAGAILLGLPIWAQYKS